MSTPTPSVLRAALSCAGLELRRVDERSTNRGVDDVTALANVLATLSMDYSEAERRVMAFVERREPIDVWRVEAARHHKIPYDQVSPTQRNAAKARGYHTTYDGRRR